MYSAKMRPKWPKRVPKVGNLVPKGSKNAAETGLEEPGTMWLGLRPHALSVAETESAWRLGPKHAPWGAKGLQNEAQGPNLEALGASV